MTLAAQPTREELDCAARVVRKHFRSFVHDPAIDQDDLDQEAALILLQERRKWKPERAPLEKFLHAVIRMRLLDSLRWQTGTIQAPRGRGLPYVHRNLRGTVFVRDRGVESGPDQVADVRDQLERLRRVVTPLLDGLPQKPRYVLRTILLERLLGRFPTTLRAFARRHRTTSRVVYSWIREYGPSVEGALASAMGVGSARLFEIPRNGRRS